MKRKFECKNCNKQFEADDQQQVVCPHCKSDNVEPANFHFTLRMWKAVVGIFALLLVCIAVFSVLRCEEEPTVQEETTIPVETDSVYTDYHETVPPTVKVSQPACNDDGLYSVDVEVKNLNRNVKFYFIMLSHFDKKILQKSEDGHFNQIPYCSEDGNSYDFAIMDSKTDTLLCVPVEQTGFVRQVTIDSEKKMTISQLQKLIDTQDESLNGVGESDYLAPDYQLEFPGLSSDIVKPRTWADLFEMIEFEQLKRATVTHVDYDDKNRIKVVTLRVVVY